MAEHEIQKVLVISTANLSPETREEMGAGAPGPCIAWEYGWFVWIDERPEEHPEVPADLRAALELGRAQGCHWVRFDADADGALELQYWED